jgi:glycosyltransferase involved in cell wall biosynthesis
MNILFVSNVIATGGSRTFFDNLCLALKKEKCKLFFVGFVSYEADAREFYLFEKALFSQLKGSRLFILSKLVSFYFSLKSILDAHRIDFIMVDIVHPAFCLLLLRPFLPKLRKVKILYQFHGLDSLEIASSSLMLSSLFSRVKKRLRILLDVHTLTSLPDQIIVFSDYAHSLLRSFSIYTPVKKVSPGVNKLLMEGIRSTTQSRARFELGLNNERRVVLLVSRLEPRKGVSDFFFSVLSDKSTLSDCVFVLVSDFYHDNYTYNFFEQISQVGRDVSILCVHKPTKAILAQWYQAADVVVLPSLALETFGFVSLEAIRFGTPVVAYDIGANRELIGSKYIAKKGKLLKKAIEIMDIRDKNQKLMQKELTQKANLYSWQQYIKSVFQ